MICLITSQNLEICDVDPEICIFIRSLNFMKFEFDYR